MDDIVLLPFIPEEYLGLNVPAALLAVIATGGSIILRKRTRGQYRTVSWLSFFSALCLILNQILSFVVNFGVVHSIVPIILAMFFQYIFPTLLWCLLFSIISATTHSRLQFHGPAKQVNVVAKTVRFIYWLTAVVVALNVTFAILVGFTRAGTFVFQIIIVFIPALIHCITFFTMMHKGKHFQDIRSFKGSFIAVLVLSVITILGPVVSFAVTYSQARYYYPAVIIYAVYTIMVRICGALALCIIVIMFPQIWLRGLREHEIRNEMGESNLPPGYDEQDQTWNPNFLYDPQPQQRYVNLDGPENTNNHKPNSVQ